MPGTDAISSAGPLKERVSTYLYIGSLYFISISILYLWGYWSTFGINILEYMTLAEVLKLSAYPLAWTAVFTAAGAVIGESFSGPLFPPGGGRHTAAGRILHSLLPYLQAVYAVATMGLFFFGSVRKWTVLPVLFAIPVALALKRRGFLQNIVTNEGTRSIIFFVLAAVPTSAYGLGRLRANAVLEGTSYIYLVDHTVEDVAVGDPSDSKARVKFLGQVSDYVFLLLPDGETTLVVQFEKTRGLHLRRFHRGPAPWAGPFDVY